MGESIKILLIEDSPEYRDVIGMAFDRDENFELVYTTGTAERALNILEQAKPQELPDLILLDLNLPGMNGVEAVANIRAIVPEVKILVLTQSDREEDVLQAIMAGASGYLLKASGIQQIKEGITMVMEGGAPLDAKVAQHILNTLRGKKAAYADEFGISSREYDVLHLMAEGLVKKQIAARLSISPFTVHNHVRHIYDKLHVQNAPAAVSQAYLLGLLPRKKQKSRE
ncbi:MAG: response regulator [Spartobacteria bacterium]